MKKLELETDYQVEKMAIQSLRPEWEDLFEGENLVHSFPEFWVQVRNWVKGFRKAERQFYGSE